MRNLRERHSPLRRWRHKIWNVAGGRSFPGRISSQANGYAFFVAIDWSDLEAGKKLSEDGDPQGGFFRWPLATLQQLQIANCAKFGVRAEFAKAALDMGLNGAEADIEGAGYFFVGKIPGEVVDNLAFTLTQRHCNGGRHGASDSS